MLGPPTDADCSAATRIDYVYRNRAGAFVPWPRTKKDARTLTPADLSHTRTRDGRIVPFIVRIETGTLDRAIYQSALLHDLLHEPAPSPGRRPAGWNGALLYSFGGGCGAAGTGRATAPAACSMRRCSARAMRWPDYKPIVI